MKPQNIVLNITNGYYYISENGVQTSSGIFSLKSFQDGNTSYFKIMDPSNSPYIYGKILICNDELVFNYSYMDGADYLFRKLK
ncbi:MAG TPA: hypothetical protein PKX92_05535 [Edaphocola sp.]|nr:hypothetical protein [Edaphocola sp.]